MNGIDDFDKRFAGALAKVPEMPDCYGPAMRRIRRRNSAIRFAWAIAATLLVSMTSVAYLTALNPSMVHADVAEELQSIQNHIVGDDIREEVVLCSLVGDETF